VADRLGEREENIRNGGYGGGEIKGKGLGGRREGREVRGAVFLP